MKFQFESNKTMKSPSNHQNHHQITMFGWSKMVNRRCRQGNSSLQRPVLRRGGGHNWLLEMGNFPEFSWFFLSILWRFSRDFMGFVHNSYGRCKGRCLIRVLSLVCRPLPANFRIKCLFCNVDTHFDCAGSHKVWAASLVSAFYL